MLASGNVKTGDSLLLILPLVVHGREGDLYIEAQAGNGLQQWLRNFSTITLCVKLISGSPPPNSVRINDLGLGDRLKVELFEHGWLPHKFALAYLPMRRKLSYLIDHHDYLHFAIGGAWGDWAALGALIAAQRGRKAAVWTDRVESRVIHIDALRKRGLRRIFGLLNAWVADRLERRVITRTTLGLFHGRDTFEAYKHLSPNPHLVHNIHLKPDDSITPDQLVQKIANTANAPLEFVYAGRVHPDKGPYDWIETLRLVSEAGVDFRARWFGDGELLDAARTKVAAIGCQETVQFTGNLADRSLLIDHMRSAHAMLFCHLTPESPRCLIEALASGSPIVGYRSPYSEDLISENGGGVLTAMSPSALAKEIIALDKDRIRLAHLIAAAAKDGAHMNDESVFAHRSLLMKRFT